MVSGSATPDIQRRENHQLGLVRLRPAFICAEVDVLLVAYGIGYGVMEISCRCVAGQQQGNPSSQQERLVRLGQLLPKGLSPRLTQVAVAVCVECNPEADFEFGLDLLLQGVEQRQGGHSTDRSAVATGPEIQHGED